jgi:hypothetical protein
VLASPHPAHAVAHIIDINLDALIEELPNPIGFEQTGVAAAVAAAVAAETTPDRQPEALGYSACIVVMPDPPDTFLALELDNLDSFQVFVDIPYLVAFEDCCSNAAIVAEEVDEQNAVNEETLGWVANYMTESVAETVVVVLVATLYFEGRTRMRSRAGSYQLTQVKGSAIDHASDLV